MRSCHAAKGLGVLVVSHVFKLYRYGHTLTSRYKGRERGDSRNVPKTKIFWGCTLCVEEVFPGQSFGEISVSAHILNY